ncbi:MAG: ubiquitin-like domain-containing protein [Caldilineaceae bacterium]
MTSSLVRTGVALAGIALLAALYLVTQRSVTVSVNGVSDTVHTHRRTVGALLLDLDLAPGPLDSVLPPPDTRLTRDLSITIARPQTVRVLADGRDLTVASWGETGTAILRDAGVAVDPADSVVLDGVVYGVDEPLPGPEVHRIPDTYARGYAWQEMEQAPRRLRLYRSIAMTVVDGGLPFTLRTTAETVGEALRDAKITLYLGDRVQPSLGSPVSTGLRVTIDRSTPVSVEIAGAVLKTRTRGRTVADVLADLKVSLVGMDRVSPPPETPLYPDVAIKVTQVQQAVEVEEQIAPFETIFEPDFGLPIDTQNVVAPGAQGITRSRTRVTYEDGVEVARVEEDNWVAQEPAQRIIAYGTRIEPQTFTTAGGEQITYWRKIRMYASSYSAGTAGVSPDQPWYGRTYSGEPMRFGVVAVDPNIIPLRSQIYVPDYGYGDALDIGGAIRARRIDLGYDDDNLQYWNRWVDVYLLWPPPPEYEITWVVPNWPRVPQ